MEDAFWAESAGASEKATFVWTYGAVPLQRQVFQVSLTKAHWNETFVRPHLEFASSRFIVDVGDLVRWVAFPAGLCGHHFEIVVISMHFLYFWWSGRRCRCIWNVHSQPALGLERWWWEELRPSLWRWWWCWIVVRMGPGIVGVVGDGRSERWWRWSN